MRKSLAFYCLVSVAVIIYTTTVALERLQKEYSPIEEIKSYGGILTLWHVDSFEGGTGSRKEFLNGVAVKFGKRSKVLILVSEYTVEGISKNFQEGKYPDMISFAPTVVAKDEIKKLPFKKAFEGEEEGGSVYAKAWCRGCYFLITKEGLSGGETYISKGSRNLAELAAVSSGISLTDSYITSPLDAYAKFCLKNGFRLIGTQRDIRRLINKGVEFKAIPIKGYSDLYQYVAITSNDKGKVKICSAFIEYLLSDEVQKTVDKIGMLPVTEVGVYKEGALKAAEGVRAESTISPFITEKELNLIREEVVKTAKEGEGIPEEIKKFLK